MAVISQKIIVRNLRGKDKSPYRIKLDEVKEGDILDIEIVVDVKNLKSFIYRLQPEIMAGRKSVIFRYFGGTVYWLGGIKPELLTETQCQEPHWHDTTVHIGGRTIKGLTPEPTADDQYTFYFRRGNKYFFRNEARTAVVECNEFLNFKRGDIVSINH